MSKHESPRCIVQGPRRNIRGLKGRARARVLRPLILYMIRFSWLIGTLNRTHSIGGQGRRKGYTMRASSLLGFSSRPGLPPPARLWRSEVLLRDACKG